MCVYLFQFKGAAILKEEYLRSIMIISTYHICAILKDAQGRQYNQCHHAMARVDFLPASKHSLQALLVIYYRSLGSGTGCLYRRLAPLKMPLLINPPPLQKATKFK